MTLTLVNDLKSLSSRKIETTLTQNRGLGSSLATGNNVFVKTVDGFLGNSLRDDEVMLGAVAKNTAYSINLLTVTEEYLNTIAKCLRDYLNIVLSSKSLSSNKLEVLNKQLNDKKSQIDLLIKTADFDNRKLFKGDIHDIQVGLDQNNIIRIHTNDFNNGKLFRTSITKALHNIALANPHLVNNYYANPQEVTEAAKKNINLIQCAFKRPHRAIGGGSLNHNITVNNVSQLLFLLNNQQKQLLDQIAPLASADLGIGGFVNARQIEIIHMITRNPFRSAIDMEIKSIIYDNTAPNTLVAGNTANRLLLQDIFQNALNSIRAEQASVSNQKRNVIQATNALRIITNATQKTSDSYLKTDYILTTQQYFENIRAMLSTITTLQASNNIPEAAQRLINSLAR